MTFPAAGSTPCPSTDYWDELDRDVLGLLVERPGGLSPAEIGHKLGMSEDAVRSILTMLAQAGKVRMHCVAYADLGDGAWKGTVDGAH